MRLKNLIIFSIVTCVFHIQAQHLVNFKNNTGLADKDVTFQFKQVLAQENKPFSNSIDLNQIDLKINNVISIISYDLNTPRLFKPGDERSSYE